MKTKNVTYRHSSHSCPAYPNGADISYYQKKLTNLLAALAAGVMLTFWLVFILRIS